MCVKLISSLLMRIFVFCSSLTLAGESAAQQPIVLWPEGTPGAVGRASQDIPTLTPYLPQKEKATGAAIIICPGGDMIAFQIVKALRSPNGSIR